MPVRLGFIWNMQTVRVVVDGITLTTLSETRKRAFTDLNFTPIRFVKYLRPAPQRTTLNEILFNDTSLAELAESMAKGPSANYFLSCFTAKDESKLKAKTLSFDSGIGSINQQCQIACFSSFNQVMLIKGNGDCVCVPNSAQITADFNAAVDCSASNSFQAYSVSNLRMNITTKKLNISITFLVSKQPIEVGESVSFKIVNSINENFLVQVNFTSSICKVSVGNSLVYHEYATAGPQTIYIKV